MFVKYPIWQNHIATELIRGANQFHSLLDKTIKLKISLKSSWRCLQLECKSESAKTEAFFSLIYPLLPLTELKNSILSGLQMQLQVYISQITWKTFRCSYCQHHSSYWYWQKYNSSRNCYCQQYSSSSSFCHWIVYGRLILGVKFSFHPQNSKPRISNF